MTDVERVSNTIQQELQLKGYNIPLEVINDALTEGLHKGPQFLILDISTDMYLTPPNPNKSLFRCYNNPIHPLDFL
jgi:hypothetical protein